MSQIYRATSAGPSPPDVPTSFVTDDGTAIPAANVLNVLGESTDFDTDNGIQTIADPDLSNNLVVRLTNRIHGQVQTTNNTPTNIATYNATSTGTYTFEFKVAAQNTTDSLGAGYSLFATVRSDSVNTFLIGTPDKIVNEEVGMEDCDFNVVVGGVGNTNVFFQATGLAAKTIEWCAVGEFCLIAESP